MAGPMFDRVLQWDTRLTDRMGVCASKDSQMGHLRPLMKLLELSCHGLVWLPGTLAALFVSRDARTQELLCNLFLGNYARAHTHFL